MQWIVAVCYNRDGLQEPPFGSGCVAAKLMLHLAYQTLSQPLKYCRMGTNSDVVAQTFCS